MRGEDPPAIIVPNTMGLPPAVRKDLSRSGKHTADRPLTPNFPKARPIPLHQHPECYGTTNVTPCQPGILIGISAFSATLPRGLPATMSITG